jgi:asparagine synthase (glutamine-hydrolysing)
MCGITGVIGMTEALGDNDFRDIQSMTSSLTHRGPDNSNVQRFSRCILGNTRLNILDLSSNANLPMSNGDGSVWIAYNGEVTNFRDLEKTHRLRDQYDFRTTSDTEVLLALYEKMGLEFCKHLTGMFAFMLYDHRVGKAWLVRDCYGIRPLFFSRMSDRVYFASEIKAFLELPEFIKEVDQDSIYHYFTLGYIPGHRTPF